MVYFLISRGPAYWILRALHNRLYLYMCITGCTSRVGAQGALRILTVLGGGVCRHTGPLPRVGKWHLRHIGMLKLDRTFLRFCFGHLR